MTKYNVKFKGLDNEEWEDTRSPEQQLRDKIRSEMSKQFKYKQHMGGSNNMQMIKPLNFNYNVGNDEYPGYITIWVDTKKMKVSKQKGYVKRSSFIMKSYTLFTPKELKYFDALGFTVFAMHKQYTEQEIEDWF
jgi:hypothetical protein